MSEYYVPEVDAGLGLIFRLNRLWDKADYRALSGDLDRWELVLDRIFSNLLYREDVDVTVDDKGTVTKVELTEKDFMIWKKYKENIRKEKEKVVLTLREKKSPAEYRRAKETHYFTIMLYDIWLRKLMQSLRLYMKETESNPSQALFGRAFGKQKYR